MWSNSKVSTQQSEKPKPCLLIYWTQMSIALRCICDCFINPTLTARICYVTIDVCNQWSECKF